MNPLRFAPAVLLAGLALAAPLPASAQVVQEAALKAAFIYNIALFTTWPADTLAADGRFYVCVAPDSPLRAALASLNNQPMHERRITLLDAVPGSADWPRCQLAVVDGMAPPQPVRGLLTVSDGADGGAAISLLLQDQHLRFDIDNSAAQRAQLEVSSKLLRLARTVR